MNDLVLPDPTSVATAALADHCRTVYEQRAGIIGVLPLAVAEEARRRASAIEEYLSGTEAYPDGQRAARVLEAAVGKALGTRQQGKKLAPAGAKFEHNLRTEFRQIADGWPRIEPYLEDDEDGHASGLSREAALRIAKGLARAYSSDDDEWYSPAPFVDAAREVMGGIDLDPCSSAIANEVVAAERFFTREDDGLAQEWAGRVWMNPPYERKTCGAFVDKLCDEVTAGRVIAACVLLNNITETVFFQRMAEITSDMAEMHVVMCFPKGRIPFWHPDKKNSPIQGQVIVYIGPALSDFTDRFIEFGFCAWVQ